MMDAITRDGNGNYFYVDSDREADKVFSRNLTGTLVTIAKDVKIQIEFNPAKVGQYRLIGYANRVLKNEDFNNDKVDAGDIGAGHTVTAFYELASPEEESSDGELKYQRNPVKPDGSDEWMTIKLRYKHPDGDESRKIEFALKGDPTPLGKMSPDYQFAAAVAIFGMKLRSMDEVSDLPWAEVMKLAKAGLVDDLNEDRAEFVSLVGRIAGISKGIMPNEAEVAPSPRNETNFNAVDGPAVRVVCREDGSKTIFERNPDSTILTAKTYADDGVFLFQAVYRMDQNMNPKSARISDGQGQELFKISYGYRKSDGQIVAEKMFDSRVKRMDPKTGEELPVRFLTYAYDSNGKRSAPISYSGATNAAAEEIYGSKLKIKPFTPEDNPFKTDVARVRASAVSAVEQLGKEVVAGHYQAALDSMYPEWKQRLAKRAGGLNKLDAQLREVPDMLLKGGITIESSKPRTTEEIRVFEVEPDKYLVIVPTVTRLRISQGGKESFSEKNSFQIAISAKGSQDWQFIDGSSVNLADLRGLFPQLPPT
ncbi:MAG: DUF3520 domain-containing protein [Luteolibacter sp.]